MGDQSLAGAAATAELSVQGMHCASCVALIEEVLSEIPGVVAASVSLEAGRAVVRFDPAAVTPERLQRVITETGYEAGPAAP